ncbi:hypothetical protein [Streptomyces nigrescens]|uniref:hypothetical protein n=1 Tax=Streptomyces nigrescens TaxID=1920 RepID=UPI0036FA22AA
MHTTTIAAPSLTAAVGPVSATALALILGLVLVLGVVGKGKKKLASGPAQLVGFFAEIAFLRSSDLPRDFGESFQAITDGLAGVPNLTIGATGVVLLLFVLSLFARIVPVSGAILGLLLAAAMDSAPGSLFKGTISIFEIPFGLMGA